MHGECSSRGVIVLSAGYSVHNAPFYASNREGLTSYLIRLQTDGHAKTLIGEELVDLGPGDLTLHAPGAPYMLSIAADAGSNVMSGDYYVFCRGRWLDDWWVSANRPVKRTVGLSDQTLGLWRQLIWQHNGVSRNKSKMEDYILRTLCLHLDDVVHHEVTSPVTADALAAHQIREFLEQNACEDLSLQDVADHMGLSISRAVHLFKATFNQTMVQFLQETRLNMACDRIRFSRMTLEEAAESSGFRSYSYFYRLFRSHFGMSPKQFRASMK